MLGKAVSTGLRGADEHMFGNRSDSRQPLHTWAWYNFYSIVQQNVETFCAFLQPLYLNESLPVADVQG
jgi:hypothetical protein